MSKQFQLGWYPARRCWKKFRDGKTYYVGQGKCRAKYDADGYKAAWEEWQAIERTLNAKRTPAQLFAYGDEAEQIALAAQRQSYYADNPLTPTYEQRREIEQAVETVRRMATAVPRSKTIRALADSFLERKKSQANVGQKSKGRFVNLRSYVDKSLCLSERKSTSKKSWRFANKSQPGSSSAAFRWSCVGQSDDGGNIDPQAAGSPGQSALCGAGFSLLVCPDVLHAGAGPGEDRCE